jgi:hypothetical protein
MCRIVCVSVGVEVAIGQLDHYKILRMLHIEPLLGKDLETNNEYSRCYAIGE